MPRLSRRQPQDLPQREEVWHALVFRMRTWITEPGKKPVRPFGLMIVNFSDGRIMGMDIAEAPTPEWTREAVFKAITQPGPGIQPHRPQALTLPDATLVAALAPALSEIGVDCQPMDTPDEVYEIVADLESHMRGDKPDVPGLLSVEGVTPEIMGDLFAAAAEFYRAAPWVRLVNAQALAVQLPTEAEPRFVSVMGNAGVEYGLSVSLTWTDFQRLASGTGDQPMDIIPAEGIRSLLFNSITQIPFDDVDAVEKYHWPVVNEQAYPMPIIFEPRAGALRPSRQELIWYQAALRAIPTFVRDHLRSDGHGDYAPAEASITVSTSEGEVNVNIRYPAGKLDRAQEPVDLIDWPDEEEEEDEIPVFDRRMMEGQMAAMASKMGAEPFWDPKLQEAQQLMYQAWEQSNVGRRITLAHQALSLSLDCADAYVLLAEEEADTVGRALEYYRQGVGAGERALSDKFKEFEGHFWSVLETRPYMRARQGLADTLWRLNRIDEARSHYQEMLRLNPGDNQGIRYLLVNLLLGMDLDDDVRKLLNQYRGEPSATWRYTTALLEFRQGGTTAKADQSLRAALRYNPFVPPYLTGQKRIPNRLPDHIGFGDENEAVAYAADHLNHWRRTDGALDWLQERLAAQSSKPAKAKKESKRQEPTLDQVVESLLAETDGPVPLDKLVQQVMARRPSKAKNPVQTITNHIRTSYRQETYTFLDRDTVMPLRLALQGARFRVTLDRQMVSSGAVLLVPYFIPFLRHLRLFGGTSAEPTFENEQGAEIPSQLTAIKVKQEIFNEMTEGHIEAVELKSWLSSLNARRGDSLLFTILDWEAGRFQLAFEPERRRRKTEVAQQNRALADKLYELLEETRDERLIVLDGLRTAYARLPSARDYPGDHWTTVIEQDGRMRWEEFEIVHAESENMSLLDMLEPPEEEAVEEKSFTSGQGKQVYRFRARRGKKEFLLEAQGTNTLGDLDSAMREAFDLDTFDHLSEFTLITSRGKGKQPRRKPFGALDPLGEYAAHTVRVAGLGLEPGAQLEYVYDFGDYIEHALVLEAVEEPEAKAKYPRYQKVSGGKRKA
jgi:tetratricopeptide (TPR) repeat protein